MPRAADFFGHWNALVSTFAGRQSLRKLQKEVSLLGILSGTTCSPVSLEDFELYLAYREVSLENLQFVVWFLDYQARFSKLPPDVQQLSPDPGPPFRIPPSNDMPTPELTSEVDAGRGSRLEATSWRTWSSHTLRRPSRASKVGAYARSPLTPSSSSSKVPCDVSALSSPTAALPKPLDGTAGHMVQMPRNPKPRDLSRQQVHPKTQPFRDETLNVVATFMRPGGAGIKELALDEDVREAVLSDLAWTTHPNVFRRVYNEIYAQLEISARNFVATQASNVNLPKQSMCMFFAILFTAVSIFLAALTTSTFHAPHHKPIKRVIRLVSVPFAYFGACAGYTAWRGFCCMVYGRGAMQLKAWEMEHPRDVGVKMRERKAKQKNSLRKRRLARAVGCEGDMPHAHQEDIGLNVVEASALDGGPDTTKWDDTQPQFSHPNLLTKSNSHWGSHLSDQSVIAPFNDTLNEHLNLDDPSSDIYSADRTPRTTSGRPRRIAIDTKLSDAMLAEREPTRPNNGSSHEIVFTRPKRRAVVDISGHMRPAIFGPERVVIDERIQKYHQNILDCIIWTATIYTTLFTAVILSFPSPHCKI